jgi:HprK-related kinase B
MQVEKFTRDFITSSIRREYESKFNFCACFDDCVVEVDTNYQRLDGKLRDYFKPFLINPKTPDIRITALEAPPKSVPFTFIIKKPDPGKTKIKEEYSDIKGGRIVRKRLTGMMFFFGDGDNLAIGPCAANYNQVVNFINNRYIEWKLNQGGVLGHAAGISVNGKGLALAGFSGMGKSTLALAILSAGADFVSNDRLIVQKYSEGTCMYGVAKYPRINPGTILHNEDLDGILSEKQKQIYQKLTPNELWMLEHKYDVPIDQYYGPGRFKLKSHLSGLVILNWERISDPPVFKKIDLAEKRYLLDAFIKETGLFYQQENAAGVILPTSDEYLKILSECDCFEITGGIHFDQAAAFCMEYLNPAGIQKRADDVNQRQTP